MKKLTALILSFIMLTGMVSAPVFATDLEKLNDEIVKITDDFETRTVDGTVWRNDNSGITIEKKATDSNPNNYAAKAAGGKLMNYYYPTSSTNAAAMAIKNRALFEFDLLASSETSLNFFKVYATNGTTSTQTRPMFNLSGGKLSVRDTKVSVDFPTNTWHRVLVDINIDAQKFSLYVDGEVVSDADTKATALDLTYPAGNYDPIASGWYIHMCEVASSSSNNLYIDNVNWRQAVLPETDGSYFTATAASDEEHDIKPTLTYSFNHDIKEDSAKYLSINGNQSYIKSAEISGRSLTVTLAKPLEYGREYTLDFGLLQDTNDSLVKESVKFKTKSSYNLIYENFDDGNYQNTKLNTASYYYQGSNTYGIENSPKTDMTGDKSFMINVSNTESSNGTNVSYRTEDGYSISGEAVVSFRMYIDSAGTNTSTALLDIKANGVNNASLLNFYNGEVRARTTNSEYVSVGSYTNNEWVDIAISFDVYNDSYCISVNRTTPKTLKFNKTTNKAKTISQINFTCNSPKSKFYLDDIAIAQKFFADANKDYGFYDKQGNRITNLNSNDTIYKATLVNRDILNQKAILYIAGYNGGCLEKLIKKEYTVPAGSGINVEEHINNLGNDALAMNFKAFWAKPADGVTPYDADVLLSRCEIARATELAPVESDYDHVVIVGVDGMGTFSRNTDTPNIDTIFADGAVTYDMLVAIPTSSSHSWASCLTGVTPDLHALNDNTLVETTTRDPESKFPTVLRMVSEEIPGADVASIATWSGINTGIVETIDNDASLETGKIYKYRNGDANGTTEAVRYIKENLTSANKSLTYIHLNDPDATGHANGYGTAEHLAEITDVDSQIGQIYKAIEEKGIADKTLFIVTSDHGGTPSGTHGSLTDAEKYAIFAAKGNTVVKGGDIEDMEIRDTAAVVLTSLGLNVPSYMSARVPSGLFEGVTAGERNVYYDPDNPRYHVPVATPAKTDAAYVSNFVDEELITYMSFDGSLAEAYGNTVTEKGNVSYEPGYFGQGVNLNDGSLALSNYDAGFDSYTVSTWVKSPCAYSRPILSTKGWNGSENCESRGHVLAFNRNTALDNPYYALFNFTQTKTVDGVSGKHTMNMTTPLPEDYDRGWMHLLYIVDKEAGTVSIAFDFGEPVTVKMETSKGVSLADVNMTTEYGSKLFIGDDYNGNWTNYAGLSLDEFMIFNGAFNRNDINDLAQYYGKKTGIADIEEDENPRAHKSVVTPAKDSYGYITNYIKDNKLNLYLPFDGNTQEATGNTVDKNGTILYRDGYYGNSLYLGSYVDYLTLNDFKLGTDSFSASFWVNINSLSGATAPVFSTQDLTKSSSQGITLYLSNKKNFNVRIGDGSNSESASFAFPENYNDGWMHITFVFDRSNKKFLVSYDFGEFTEHKLTNENLASKTADGATGYSFAIGNDSKGKYWTPLRASLDEFMIFDGVLDNNDLDALKLYYGK